jgi:sigma-B regulation protein RsbU (phosphoserine phosphatase)
MNLNLILSTLNLIMGGLVLLLGLVIFRENPGQRLNRLVALTLFFGGVGAMLATTALVSTRTATPAAAGQAATDLVQNFSYLWEFFFPTLFMFASVFPEERGFTRRREPGGWRRWTPPFAVWVFAPHVFHFLLMLVVSVWKPDLTLPEVGPLRYFGPVATMVGVFLRLFLLIHQALFSLVNLGFGLATMLLLFDSYRRARVRRLKRQLRVIAIGLSACLVCYSLATSIPGLFNFQLDAGVRTVLTLAALTLGPGSIAYSIVRYKFLDTKLLARRGILYALASTMLVGIYLIVVGRVNRFLTHVVGADSRMVEPFFLIMALALFQPVVARLEEILDQMFLKDPSDYRNIVRQLGRELQTTIDLEELLSRTIGTLAEAMLLERAYVVALTREGALAHTGAGQPLSTPALARVAELLPRISARESGYRLSDRIEGIEPESQAFLADELKLDLVVPLRWRGEILGALLLGHKVTGTNLTSEDLTLLTTLAGQVSVSLQNALLLRDRISVARFEEELNLARQIQRTSLISDFPHIPNCEVHAVSIPSKHVGGDFYDVVATEDGAYLVAIADVSGKGVPAALLSSMLQASLRTQAAGAATVSGILRNINSLLYRSTATQQFATFFLARVEGARGELTFSNAGHNWPIVLKPDGERQYLERGGTVLGILESVNYEEGQVRLAPGDLVVLYTDGMSEATDASGEQFGDERVCRIVQDLPRDLSAREIAERLMAAWRQFLGEVEPQDDMTLLVLRVTERVPAPPPEEPRREIVAAR